MADPHHRNTLSFAVHVRAKREVGVYVTPCDAQGVVTSATTTATADVIDNVGRQRMHGTSRPLTSLQLCGTPLLATCNCVTSSEEALDQVVEGLLAAGVDWWAKNYLGMAALHLAAQQQHNRMPSPTCPGPIARQG